MPGGWTFPKRRAVGASLRGPADSLSDLSKKFQKIFRRNSGNWRIFKIPHITGDDIVGINRRRAFHLQTIFNTIKVFVLQGFNKFYLINAGNGYYFAQFKEQILPFFRGTFVSRSTVILLI
jgi:hypothetical protein